METRGLLRSTVPLILLIAFALVSPSLQTSSLGLRLEEERVGDYTFEELSHLFPEGVGSIGAAASLGQGALIVGSSTTGKSVILRYDPSQPRIATPFEYLPPHYYAVGRMAAMGSRYLISGWSVGTSTVLGVYDASSSAFADHTNLLPPDTQTIQLITPAGSSFFVVLTNETQFVPAMLDPSGGSLTAMEVEGFENLTTVSHAAWNGSHLYIGGVWAGGDPALLALNPSNGSLEDLSGLLPGDIDRVDYLVWADNALYILGIRYWFWSTRASLAVFDPVNRTIESLTTPAWNEYTKIQMGLWNGTALLMLVQDWGWHTLAAYYPANDTTFFTENLIPGYWSYVAMLPSGQDLLFVANYYGPAVGIVRLDTWTWEEKDGAFEGPYETVVSTSTMGDSFVLVGGRTASGALGLLDPSGSVLEDRSDDLDLADTVLVGASWNGQRLLLSGANQSSGVLYTYDPSTGSVDNLTSTLPEDIEILFVPSWNGSVYAIPGYGNSKASLLLFDPATNTTTDLGAAVRLYFRFVTAVVAYDDLFLVIGYNSQGAAMAVLDAATGDLRYLGNELGELYGLNSLLTDAAWNDEALLIGGFYNDRPILGLWSPDTETYDDLTSLLPKDFGGIYTVVWTGESFVVGGRGDSASLGVYYPANETFVDLSSILPPSYLTVDSLEVLDGDVLVLSRDTSGDPVMGILSVERAAPGPLDALPGFLQDPSEVAIFGLSVALVAVLAFLAGRRGRRPEAVPPPTQHPYGPGPQEMPEAYEEEQYPYGP
jgi:hypothetical protein